MNKANAAQKTITIPLDEYEQLQKDSAAYQKIHTPEIDEFIDAVKDEALYQRYQWGSESESGKTDADWFWLVGYLSGKALSSFLTGNLKKGLHHTISSAAALLNWHSAKIGAYTAMRPGTEQKEA